MRASRSLYQHALTAAVLLSVGVGAAASMFTVLRALSPLGLPYPDADRLVVARVGGPSWSPGMLGALVASSTVLEEVAGVQERAATLAGGDAAEIIRLESVSASYFDLLGAKPARGRVFGPDEDQRDGAVPVAVVSEVLWNRRFGRNSDLGGSWLDVDGHPLEVIGVMPAGFGGLIGRTDAWTPLGSARWLSGDTGPERPTSRWFEVVARRRAAVTLEAALPSYATETRTAMLQIPGGNRIVGPKTSFTLTPLADARVPPIFPQAARVLAIGVAAVLLLVIVNITSLHLLRTDIRRREFAIRLALGANLRQIAMMALREAGGIAAAGAVGGLALRPLLLSALAAIQPNSTSFGIVTSRVLTAPTFEIDAPVVSIVVALAIAGSAPLALAVVLQAKRLNVERTLRGRSAAAASLRSSLRPWRAMLVMFQAAMACAVIGGGALLTRSADQLLGRDRGYEIDHVMTARVSLPAAYDGRRAAAFYRDLVDRLAASPGITRASVSNCAPGGGRCRRTSVSGIDGHPIEPSAQPTIGIHYVTPGHFGTIGARVAGGRAFDETDRGGAPLVAVVSGPLAATLWPGANPIGRTLDVFTANGSLDGSRTVVGVVNPIAFDLEGDPGLDVFLPAAQAVWTSGVVFVRGPGSPGALEHAVAQAVASLDRSVPVFDAGGLDVPLGRSLSVESFMRRTLLAFGALGLLLAAFGTYAVIARSVAQGRRELGIRVALGATPNQIRSFIARRGAVIATVSAAAGTLGAAWSGALLRSLLHGLASTDPVALGFGSVITTLAVLTAVAVPALRASHANPVTTMRGEG